MRTLKKPLNANSLKMIAIAAMLLDHFVAIFIPHHLLIAQLLRIPGRIVAPVMCYFIAEGFHYTRNIKKYIFRLFLFALVSHLPYNLSFGYTFFQATSVMWGLTLGLVALTAVKKTKFHPVIKLAVIGICCLLSITADWNYVAVLWIVWFGLFFGDFKNQMIGFAVIGVVVHLIPTFLRFGFTNSWYQLAIFLAIPLLLLYNGKLGKKSKTISWFFYIFYPAHLLILYLLKTFTSLPELFR